jgi:type IV pilus assembly protein PilO
MKRQVPVTLVVALALVVVVAVAYFTLIRPQRAESARLDEEIAALEPKVDAALAASQGGEAQAAVRVAEIFELAKAIPGEEDMAGIILELDSVATSAGTRFLSITPAAPTEKGDYRAIPISLTFEGSYYDLTDFLFRLRNLVAVRDGELAVKGRLFTLDSLDMHAAREGFPQIEAALTISAYVYGAGAAATTTVAEASDQAAGGSP